MDLTHIYERKVDPEGQDSLARIGRLIQPGSTVLELGPATGYFTRHLSESLGCTVDCIEYSPEMAELARPFARTLHVGDLDQLDVGDYFDAETYDHVIAADVLEHLKNPWRVLRGCRDLLKPTGSVLLSIPNIGHAALISELIAGRFEYRDEGLLDRTHLRFFTRGSIIDMLGRTGLRPKTIDRIEWMTERTEFARILEEMPPRLRHYLLTHGDALTYQFIVHATPGDMTEAQRHQAIAEGEGPAEPYFLAKLYWAAGNDGLDEVKCIIRPVPLRNESCRVRFDLPADAPFNKLRFDPADRPGFVRFKRIHLYEKSPDGAIGPSLIDCDDCNEISKQFRLDDLVRGDSALSTALIATSDDPKLFYTSDTDFRPTAGSHFCLDVQMSWPISADFLIADNVLGKKIYEYESQIDAKQLRIEELLVRIDQLRHKNANLSEERDDAAMFEPRFIQQEARTRELEKVLGEIYGSRAWRAIARWRRFKSRFLGG